MKIKGGCVWITGKYAYFLNQRKYLAKDRMFLVAINKSYATASENQAEMGGNAI
jgi:hypothetical protein